MTTEVADDMAYIGRVTFAAQRVRSILAESMGVGIDALDRDLGLTTAPNERWLFGDRCILKALAQMTERGHLLFGERRNIEYIVSVTPVLDMMVREQAPEQ